MPKQEMEFKIVKKHQVGSEKGYPSEASEASEQQRNKTRNAIFLKVFPFFLKFKLF